MKIWANIGGLAGGKVQPGIAPLQKKEVEGEGEALELFNPGNQTQPIQIGSWNQALWLLVLLAFNSKQATV